MPEATPRTSSAWWVWLVSASFLLNFALILYGDWSGPTLGFISAYNQGSVIILSLYAPSTTLPLKEGDRITRADGQPISSAADWFVVLANLRVGTPVNLEVQRGGQNLQLSATPGPQWSVGFFHPGTLLLLRIGQMMMLGVACFVAFARPRSPTALLAALVFAGLSLFNVPESISGFAALFHDLPALIVGLLRISEVGSTLTPLFLFLFSVTFPRPLIHSRARLAILCVPPLLLLIPQEIYSYRLIYDPSHAIGMSSDWFNAATFTNAAYFLAGPVALALNYRRLTGINERRRIRVLVAGVVIGLLPLVLLILIFGAPVFRFSWFGRFVLSSTLVTASVALAFLVFPVSFAYAVLRHRLFDVRIIVRQALQHATARGVLLSALPLLAAAFSLDIFVHRAEPLGDVIAARGFTYSALGLAAAVLFWKRQNWLDRLDRRFFRDRYDAQQVLQRVVLDLKDAGSFETAAGEVVRQVHAALHPEFVSVLYRVPGQMELRSIACAPADHRPPEIPVGGKVMAFLRVLEKPIQLSTLPSIAEALSGEERTIVSEQRIELAVPVSVAPDRSEAVLVLGPKRSEEPYSREDERLLSAIGASLALLLASRVREDADGQTFQECTECGRCFNAGEPACSEHGSSLVRVYMPRILANRYRLERRIGRGGMGAVYAGVDESLGRPVAIKVIRPDLIENGSVRARFHQEARGAAALLHRNVITIYDFGIEGQHPFIVMELLSGRTLRAELQSCGRLAAERTIEILDGVCAAIEEAHRRQFLHRDIKPENIFLARTPTGEVVKVLDFGLMKAVGTSRTSSATTASGGIAGTPCYMAPEILSGERASPASDVWALGVVAFEMLTGGYPSVDQTAAGWGKAVLRGTFASFSLLGLNLPESVQPVFEGVFRGDPANRAFSAGSFFVALRLALKGQSDEETQRNDE